MFNRLIGSIFLISGTSIGAGMLGLPIKLVGINFTFNTSIFLICWLMIIISSVSMLEISLWTKNDSNIISIATDIIGKKFSNFIAFSYIFFYMP